MATSLSKPNEVPVIRKWSTTYYIEETRKWHKGQLKLSHSLLSFHEQPSGKIDLAVDIDSISDVKIERSWLGYNTLVVLVGARKFWFASLDSSQSVRRVLLHFIKDSLLCNKNEVMGPRKSSCSGNNGSVCMGSRRSEFGSELLSLAHDSQRTLSEAASQLTSQGEQLDGALRTTDSLQRDLGVGSLHITHLESWLGLWHVSAKDLELQLPRHGLGNSTRLQDGSSNTEATEFPVIYRLSKSLVEESGTLNVDDSSLTIRDEKKREAIQFALREISTVAVTTPWSMLITRRLIGRPDITCHVTSANLITILKALELRVKGKIEYDEPTDVAFTLPDTAVRRCTIRGIELGRADVVSATNQEGDWPIGGGQQAQVTAASQSEVVTESEADELSSVLRDLKSLAVGVGNELDVQDEKITQLTEDVDSLSDGVKRSNKRMQRLL